MEHVYLTRRNLLTLLAKLDHNKNKAENEYGSACTLVKSDTVHPKYPCSAQIAVTAVEDEDYYEDRSPGPVHPREERSLANPTN